MSQGEGCAFGQVGGQVVSFEGPGQCMVLFGWRNAHGGEWARGFGGSLVFG